MAFDPLFIDASGGVPEYTSAEVRRGLAWTVMYDGRLVGGRQGIRPGGNQFKVTLAGSTITVDLGVGVVDPALTTPQGPYPCGMGTQETHALTAADATNPRKDIVVLRIYDHVEDASGQRKAQTEYIAGTPAPSPSEPAVPAGAMKLATLDVPASGGGSPVVTDRRVWTVAPGGILPVNVAGDITAGVAGRYRARLDQGGVLERDTGSAWVPVGGPPDVQVFTASGTWNKPAGARSVRVRVVGGGGAGGGAPTNAGGSSAMGGGGGGGEYAEAFYAASALASSETVTVGAGGTGVSGAAGNNGGNSSFSSSGTLTSANGGSGGPVRSTSSVTFGQVGGAGGTGGTGGSVRVKGGAGGYAFGAGALGVSGQGGDSGIGGGGGLSVRTVSDPSQAAGNAGGAYGGGGSGGITAGTGTAVAGGAGAAGVVIVETYF